jgi:hypothetical protein
VKLSFLGAEIYLWQLGFLLEEVNLIFGRRRATSRLHFWKLELAFPVVGGRVPLRDELWMNRGSNLFNLGMFLTAGRKWW